MVVLMSLWPQKLLGRPYNVIDSHSSPPKPIHSTIHRKTSISRKHQEGKYSNNIRVILPEPLLIGSALVFYQLPQQTVKGKPYHDSELPRYLWVEGSRTDKGIGVETCY